MQKLRATLLINLISIGCMESQSRTFFSPSQVTTNPVYELALDNYHQYYNLEKQSLTRPPLGKVQPKKGWTKKLFRGKNKKIGSSTNPGVTEYTNVVTENDNLFEIQTSVFYQHSTNESDLAKYFLPNNKSSVSVRENGTGDLGSLWFSGISAVGTNYTSELSLKPRRETMGFIPKLYARFTNDIWLTLMTAIINAEHSMNLVESDRTYNGTISGFASLVDYFNSNTSRESPQYGRIRDEKTSSWGFDDIQIKLGYDAIKLDNGHLGLYGVVTMPTGGTRDLRALFDPVIGTKSNSLGFGVNWGKKFLKFKYSDLTFLSDIKCRYAFEHKSNRTFDLRFNGEWSRYLQVVHPGEVLNPQPAVNLLNCRANVRPGNTLDWWNAIHYNRKNIDFEVGYSIWARQQERVKISDVDCNITGLNIGIFDMVGTLAESPTSASNADITVGATGSNTAPSDVNFLNLKTSELDLESAAHPKTLSHKLYAALSYKKDQRYLGLGISYEIADSKNEIEQIGLWGTASILF